MKRSLTIAHESWPIAGSFTISRGSKTKADVVVVNIWDKVGVLLGNGDGTSRAP